MTSNRGRCGADSDDTGKGSKHGGIAIGAVLIAVAIGLNFLLDGMSEDEVAEMPWFIALAFQSGGKMGVTLVLCTIAVLFIAWDVVTQSAGKEEGETAPARSGGRGSARKRAKPAEKKDSPADEEPIAEEIPEDAPETAPRPPAKMPGGCGRSGSRDGAVVLTTAKYLPASAGGDGGDGGDRDGLPDFRKGRTRHTRTDE